MSTNLLVRNMQRAATMTKGARPFRQVHTGISRATRVRPQEQVRAIRFEDWMQQSQSSQSTNGSVDYAYNSWSLPLSDWFAKIPKGFENFYPKDHDKGESNDPEKESNKEKEPSKDKFSFQGDKQKKQQQGGGGGPSYDNDPQNTPALIVMLLMILAARRYFGNDEGSPQESRNGQEITFMDFRNRLLETGQVEKIIVVNNNMARVVLHPGSKGLAPKTSESLTASMDSSEFSTSNTSSVASQQDTDTTMMDFNQSAASEAPVLGSATTALIGKKEPTPAYHFYIGSIESFEEKLSKAQGHIHPRDWIPVQYVNEVNLFVEFIKATPMIAMLAMIYYYSRGMMGGASSGAGGNNLFQIGKSNAKKINPESVNINFSHVAGCQQAKQEIMEFVDFLKDSSRFEKLGAKIPKGALLCGPPGTGKTLLAKAVAGEAGVPFFSISGSDFIASLTEMFVGVGPSRVRDLFKEARENAPCIVFIDEIDAVGRQRGKGGFSGGNDERENTLNQLLVEMDGFTTTTGVVVLAGTNRIDILDQALTRPGRFDRQITVDKPDLQGRKEIFNVHLNGITLEGEMDDYSGRLAGLTPGFAGADIANLCNEAAIVAARRKAETVTIDDFEKATDRIIGGLESNKIMSDQEKQIVAHHEAGHAVAGWFLEHADPLLKVTIIPRTSGALGFAQYLPKEVFLRTQDQIMDIVCMALAGRAAEEVFFGRVTTGASDDLRRVTQMVYSTIMTYGMNSRVGQLAYPQDNDGMPGDKPYSDATAEAMDEEARAIVDAAYLKTVELIRERKDQVEAVANLLMEKETITHDDMIDLIGARPFQGDAQYQEYVSARHQSKPEPTKPAEEEEQDFHHDGGLTPGLAMSGKVLH
eukprot:Nitzschia sp. Nitz4//scaffold5_size260463//237077//239735//NITZ4_001029-RA/size260463-augustus-gene-0.23-mRNA-1//1//CDS//3329555481//8156//frame0